MTPTPEPTPEFRQTVVVQPVRGTVRVRRPGSNEFVDLDAGAGIPLGATIDTKKGEVELTSLPAAGAPPQTARFSDGIFNVTQSGVDHRPDAHRAARAVLEGRRGRRPRSPNPAACGATGGASSGPSGRYSAATVRGTKWLVQDSCNGTLVRVTQGVVAVRDKVKRKTVIVRAPQAATRLSRGANARRPSGTCAPRAARTSRSARRPHDRAARCCCPRARRATARASRRRRRSPG